MLKKKLMSIVAAVLLVVTFMSAQQTQQQSQPPLTLRNHPKDGIESPGNGASDLSSAAAVRFTTDAAISTARGRLAASDATVEASCSNVKSQKCYTAKAEYRSRLAELFTAEQQAAENEANFQATLARRIEQLLERGPDTSAVSTEIQNMIESCGDNSFCKELRPRVYQALSKHSNEWDEAVAEARKALLLARQAEEHFRQVAYQQQAQRILALRDTADFQHIAELKRLAADVLAASENTNLPSGTVVYAGLFKGKKD